MVRLAGPHELATELGDSAAICGGGSMDVTPEPNEPPAQRASPVWLALSLFLGWGVGAAGFALVIQRLGGAIFSDWFAMPPTWLAIGSGFFVGLLAVQITVAGCRERRVPWTTLVGSLLGMGLAAVLGYLLANAIGARPMQGEARYALYFGMAGALAGALVGGRIAKDSK
jgi:hypothetical protein